MPSPKDWGKVRHAAIARRIGRSRCGHSSDRDRASDTALRVGYAGDDGSTSVGRWGSKRFPLVEGDVG